MQTILRSIAGEPSVPEQFHDVEFIAAELGISVARVEGLVKSSKLECTNGPGGQFISIASARRVATEMQWELASWRHDDTMRERAAAKQQQRAESENPVGERDAEQRAMFVRKRVTAGERVPGTLERTADEDLLFRTRKKLDMVANIAWRVLSVENLSPENSDAFEAICLELNDLRAMTGEIEERFIRGELVHKKSARR